MLINQVMQRLTAGQDLSTAEARAVFDRIFRGELVESELQHLLIALRDKGESVAEILGAAQSMRSHMQALTAPVGAMDIVGTGGDGRNTLNVSTAAAIVVAACGVPVAKHGNRAASSRSGSSDALRELGVNLEPSWAALERCATELGLIFLFAPRHHPAMRHVANVRRAIGTRTIFNVLGPLTNPANVKRHLLGVYDQALLRPLAEVLQALGSESAWLAHGHDGCDEITITAPTDIVAMNQGQIKDFTVSPETAGLPRASLDAIQGGDASVNAEAIRRLLAGERSAYRAIVLLNAAAALVVATKAPDLKQGAQLAASVLDSGAAAAKLAKLCELTNA
jgi:anthranilate phosphoribosyltransferase